MTVELLKIYFVFLVCGHTLGEFVFQTNKMVERKKDGYRWLLIHGLEIGLIHTLVMVPFWAVPSLFIIPAITIIHLAIDKGKELLQQRCNYPLALLFIDQGFHFATLLLAAYMWLLFPGKPPFAPYFKAQLPLLTSSAIIISAYAFNIKGGALIVFHLLQRFNLPAIHYTAKNNAPSDTPSSLEPRHPTNASYVLNMGQIIGVLERMLLLTFILIDQWGALGLVLAAKSIARYKDLEIKNFGEYYLIGTLASVLIAAASGLLAKALI